MKIDSNGWPIPEREMPPKEIKRPPFCKLKINSNTTVYVKSQESLDLWLQKFPDAIKIEFKGGGNYVIQ